MSSITAVNFINTHSLNGGTFNATFVSLITGLLADLKTVYGLSGVTGLGDENISSKTTVQALLIPPTSAAFLVQQQI